MPPRNVVVMEVDAGPTSMDVDMEETEDHGMSNGGHHQESSSNAGSSVAGGVETPPPQPQQAYRIPRRGSMSEEEERERRASIKAILADKSISPQSRRRSIQHLMDGRRGSLGASTHGGSVNSGGSSVASDASSNDDTASYHSGVGGPPLTIHTTPHGYEGEDCFEACEQIRRMEQSRPPCTHYERNCTMIAPCCGAAFGCRICHDDCPILPPKIELRHRMHRSASLPSSFTTMNSVPQDTHHNIDRFAVKEVICRECFTRQSSKT
jgi:CHY zinc finger